MPCKSLPSHPVRISRSRAPELLTWSGRQRMVAGRNRGCLEKGRLAHRSGTEFRRSQIRRYTARAHRSPSKAASRPTFARACRRTPKERPVYRRARCLPPQPQLSFAGFPLPLSGQFAESAQSLTGSATNRCSAGWSGAFGPRGSVQRR